MRSAVLVLLAPLSMSAAQPVQRCQMPVAIRASIGMAPHSTYYNDGEPPARFAHVPRPPIRIRFGQQAIDELCGRPPCGMFFEGCTDGDQMALPDPYKTPPEVLARIVRHELAHVNGWPASHGD